MNDRHIGMLARSLSLSLILRDFNEILFENMMLRNLLVITGHYK